MSATTPERVAVGFVRSLRNCGVVVPVDATIAYGEALALVGFREGARVYWAGRATLVRRPEDTETYNNVFNAYFGGTAVSKLVPVGVEHSAILDGAEEEDADFPNANDTQSEEQGDVKAVRFSRVEVLREQDFSTYTDSDRIAAQRLMSLLVLHEPKRESRRLVATRRSGTHPDFRSTVSRSMRNGGELIDRRYKKRSLRPRRVLLLLDVSGSMEPYAREFIRFLHTAVSRTSSVEAFALGTRLTRMTRDLQTRDPDAAIASAAEKVVDYSGGTRLGETLGEFNARWGSSGIARGAVVVILSDGWDRGDAERLDREMARLERFAHSIIWVNPLKATTDYTPIARGMAAALPYVDEFVAGNSIAALEAVAVAIGRDRR